MATTTKALKDMSLTDLVLPDSALNNIIENEELDRKLELYSTTAEMNAAIDDKFGACVTAEDFDSTCTTLQNNIDGATSIARGAAETAEATSSKCTALENALGDFKFAVLEQAEYNDIIVPDANTLYFIKAPEVSDEPHDDETPPAEDPTPENTITAAE